MKKIGITAFYVFDGARRMTHVDRQYVEAIASLGALPVIIPETADKNLAASYIDEIDGLLVTGGCDVNPLYYGAEPGPYTTTFSTERDLFEEVLIRTAIEKGVPCMGVCRGMQMINCALGGTLIQHIPAEVKNCLCHCEKGNEQWEPSHTVEIKEGSILSPIFGNKAVVNSYHHQAVKTLGENLTGIAYSPDGLCEAYEWREKKVFAVQWHPEKMYHHDEKQLGIFKTFLGLVEE